MKYVAVCVLSILTMLSASAAPVAQTAQSFAPAFIAPAVAPDVPDSLLMTMLGGALIALQLRRRQKSLRSPRLSILST